MKDVQEIAITSKGNSEPRGNLWPTMDAYRLRKVYEFLSNPHVHRRGFFSIEAVEKLTWSDLQDIMMTFKTAALRELEDIPEDDPENFVRDVEIVDEMSFWGACQELCRSDSDPQQYRPRDIIASSMCKVHHKRCWGWLQKWTDRGLYEYGVAVDMGWMEAKAKGLQDPREWRSLPESP